MVRTYFWKPGSALEYWRGLFQVWKKVWQTRISLAIGVWKRSGSLHLYLHSLLLYLHKWLLYLHSLQLYLHSYILPAQFATIIIIIVLISFISILIFKSTQSAAGLKSFLKPAANGCYLMYKSSPYYNFHWLYRSTGVLLSSLNSDMDYRIFSMRTWSFLCVYIKL